MLIIFMLIVLFNEFILNKATNRKYQIISTVVLIILWIILFYLWALGEEAKIRTGRHVYGSTWPGISFILLMVGLVRIWKKRKVKYPTKRDQQARLSEKADTIIYNPHEFKNDEIITTLYENTPTINPLPNTENLNQGKDIKLPSEPKASSVTKLEELEPDIYVKFITDYSSYTKILIDSFIVFTAKEDGSISNIYYRFSDSRNFKILSTETPLEELNLLIGRFDLMADKNVTLFGPKLLDYQIEKCKITAWEKIESHLNTQGKSD